jgi:hypothetical protein
VNGCKCTHLAQLRVWQTVGLGSLDLAVILAEFRRNPRQPESLVNLLFACTQDLFAAGAGQRVLREREAAFEGDLAQVDVVVF